MASPPYNQSYASSISPPYPPNAQLPQPPKRRQSDMPSSAPSLKRRKASMLSTTSAASHPLRQTSFPPPENAMHTPSYSRSPSVDTMSLVSGSAVGTKKKRPRKSTKGIPDDSSVAGGKAKSTASGPEASRKRRASREPTEEEEDDDVAADEILSGTAVEERRKEQEHRALLVSGFDSEQFSRWEAFRNSRLGETVVRKLVNQNLSQSAPANVILAIRTVSKLFAGEIIESARKIQTEWLEASGEDQIHEQLPSPPAEGAPPREKEKRRGPLLPDHLREAVRRYKATRDGGMAGHLGLSKSSMHSGVERFGIRFNGKRLLK